MSVSPPRRPRTDLVARAATTAMTAALVLMLARVAQLQLWPAERLREQGQPRLTRATLPAARGDVMDRLGRPMATSELGYRAFVDPQELDDPDETIARLSEVLKTPAEVLGPRILACVEENRHRTPAAAESPRKPTLGDAISRLLSGPPEVKAPRTGPLFPEDLPPAPIRYLRVSDVLSDEVVESLKREKLRGVHLERRGVRLYPGGGLAASIVGKVGADEEGLLGAERAHEGELTGESGRIFYVRDARGRPLWMSPGAYAPARAGEDVRLSVDLEVQRVTTEELRRAVEDSDAAGGRAVVMDPRTGEILAMVDLVRAVPDAVPFPWADAKGRGEPWVGEGHRRYITLVPDPGRATHPALARNRCVEDVYEPGSTFKPFVWATVTELGRCEVGEVFNTGHGQWYTPYGRLIHDVVKRPEMTWTEVLINSSNIGMSQGGARLSFDELLLAVRRFGFGSRTNLGLQGETPGLVTPRSRWSKYTQTSVSFGHEIGVTPVQMARAFCVFARGGELAGTLPPARLTAADQATPPVLHRVLRPDVAVMTRTILHEVAAAMEARMAENKDHPESGWRYGLFGKSGTAEIPLGRAPEGKRRPPGNKGYFEKQYNASFIAGAPIEDPRLVVLVVIDDPGPERVRAGTYYGSYTAGPAVRRIMERALSYLGVPPSPAPARESPASGPMAD